MASDALRGRSRVLRLDGVRTLELPVGSFIGPLTRCRGLRGRELRQCKTEHYSPHVYNPSIAAAPPGLCSRCRFIVAVRVAHQHQCASDGAMNRGFEGTALAVLDEDLTLLGWDWWFNRAVDQLRGDLQRPAERVRWRPDPADAWDHARDAALQGHMATPSAFPHYDTRLLTLPTGRVPSSDDGNGTGALLLATVQCRRCKELAVLTIHLRAIHGVGAPAARLRALRAWSPLWPGAISRLPLPSPSFSFLL